MKSTTHPTPTELKPVTGFAALHLWCPQFKHGHLPPWFKKRMRGHLIAQGLLNPDPLCWIARHHNLFDHWGSVPNPEGFMAGRIVYSMPYHPDPRAFDELARAINCRVTVIQPGPWHAGTIAFLLTPNTPEI